MEIILVTAISLIIAITVHEFAHAFAADHLGDPTPRSQGRLSLNPLRHLDILGTVMLFIAHFGWGKPVVIDPYNFRNPKRDEILVSLAGPSSNIILAVILGLIIRFFSLPEILYFLFIGIIQMNIALAVFNLLPVPPLDGSKIFLNLLSEQKAIEWKEAFDRYGMFLLVILLFFPIGNSNIINLIISPIIRFILSVLIP